VRFHRTCAPEECYRRGKIGKSWLTRGKLEELNDGPFLIKSASFVPGRRRKALQRGRSGERIPAKARRFHPARRLRSANGGGKAKKKKDADGLRSTYTAPRGFPGASSGLPLDVKAPHLANRGRRERGAEEFQNRGQGRTHYKVDENVRHQKVEKRVQSEIGNRILGSFLV